MNEVTNDALRALLAGAANGDETAFGRLYEATSPKLFGVALRILKREDWAEEVLQDCYVSIWNNATRYEATLSAPMTWMTSIVRNRSIDWLRRPALEVSVDVSADERGSFMDSVASDDPGPLDVLARSSESREIARCLEQLSDDQRRAVVLAFMEGLAHPEVAERMDRPLGTVKTWIRRGLQQLRGCLE